MKLIWREAARVFGLGAPLGARPVAGGLSNDLWRPETDRGRFAVKVMRVNADRPDFRDNVESAFAVEINAFRRGVALPEPIALPDGRCLAETAGRLVRAHHWVEGRPARPGENLVEAGTLLASVHRAGEESERALNDDPRDADAWASLAEHPEMASDLATTLRKAAPELAALERATAASGLVTKHSPSHGDLDPKNALIVGGEVMAVDWDAAGVYPSAREAVSLALDWSTDVEGFRRVLDAYAAEAKAEIPPEPWVLGAGPRPRAVGSSTTRQRVSQPSSAVYRLWTRATACFDCRAPWASIGPLSVDDRALFFSAPDANE